MLRGISLPDTLGPFADKFLVLFDATRGLDMNDCEIAARAESFGPFDFRRAAQPDVNRAINLPVAASFDATTHPGEMRGVGFRGVAVRLRMLKAIGVHEKFVRGGVARIFIAARADLIEQRLAACAAADIRRAAAWACIRVVFCRNASWLSHN